MKKYAKTPTVFQMECTECGAASLAMIMAYFGKHIPLDKLRIDTGVSRDGCRASKILAGARKHGLETEGRRMGLDALLARGEVPCIIHWNFNHFVVFEGVRGEYAYINDPAMGRRKLTINELDEGFTGIALFFRPTASFTPEKKKKTLLSFIRSRLKGQLADVAYLVLLGILTTLPGLLGPVFSRVFVDDVLIGQRIDQVSLLLLAMVVTALFRMFLTDYRGLVLLRLQNKISLLSTHRLITHLFRLPMSFFDQRYAGDISSRVENNTDVCEFIAGDLAQTALNIFASAVYLLLLVSYSPWLTLLALAVTAVNFTVIKLTSESMSRNVMKLQQDQGKLVGIIFSGINIITTLKAAGIENDYAGRVLGYYAKKTIQERRLAKMMQILTALPDIMERISSVLVLMLGGVFVIKGSMTAGMLVAFSMLLAAFMEPVNELLGFVQKIQQIKADMSRVDDILSYGEDDVFAHRNGVVGKSEKLSGQLVLRDISFGYSPLEKPLVENFSFSLPTGSSIAFVGTSGSGKSTVAKVISGLYEPWGGSILVDGVPLNEMPQEVVASSISTVSQEISLFSGTIRDNITMWSKMIRDEDIVRAAKDACIHDDITKKPGAYEYRLTEGGRNLSGGQRQRLEIARALVTNPSILIMDEATSALDAIVEKEIVDNIKRRGCTCVVVAHRLSAIRDCDEIIVMERGKIVQRGTHEQLVNQPGHYQKLLRNL